MFHHLNYPLYLCLCLGITAASTESRDSCRDSAATGEQGRLIRVDFVYCQPWRARVLSGDCYCLEGDSQTIACSREQLVIHCSSAKFLSDLLQFVSVIKGLNKHTLWEKGRPPVNSASCRHPPLHGRNNKKKIIRSTNLDQPEPIACHPVSNFCTEHPCSGNLHYLPLHPSPHPTLHPSPSRHSPISQPPEDVLDTRHVVTGPSAPPPSNHAHPPEPRGARGRRDWVVSDEHIDVSRSTGHVTGPRGTEKTHPLIGSACVR